MKRLIALTLLLMASAFPVNAHSALVSSVPSANATVVDFPMEVVLNFNEDLMIVGDENPNKVEVCGISEWNGKSLSLEIDHIDGLHTNNNPNNLRIICPNCHSQTDTYKAKNKGNGRASRRAS